ncbi:MAG: hypothetical protein M1823_008014 [Watsoniomyces obsoletus]|nr:MAG: hypothetical protein M1823_008014 [Watsoniomyces obsoletus]
MVQVVLVGLRGGTALEEAHHGLQLGDLNGRVHFVAGDEIPHGGLAHLLQLFCSEHLVQQLAAGLHGWAVTPSGTEGYRKAEVMAGGVDTRGLSSQTMESRTVPGLHFIGEVVDVTGWLGGYNFQWAWASAAACGRAIGAALAAG